LASVFDDFAHEQFPSLKEQLDADFDDRYNAFWLEIKKRQKTLFSTASKVAPSKIRLDFDIAICKALGINVTEDELVDIYKVLVQEMIATKGLARD
jgi:hypothetical protein